MQFSEHLRRRSPLEMAIMAFIFIGLLSFIYTLLPDASSPIITNFCPQSPQIFSNPKFDNSSKFFSFDYSNKSLESFQGAIRIPTVSYDDMNMDPKLDERFQIFYKLHEYFEQQFPLTFKHVEKVNEIGLLYTIQGSNPDLKPVVLMSHQDVVPVAESSLDLWDYPPFEAHFDGEFIYGRGTSDTKNSLVSILEATEDLLSQQWVPERTLILSFGFDEEISGFRGAASLSNVIYERYGKNGVELIIDEGTGLTSTDGIRLASVTVAEKGYVDLSITLQTPGGHSSVPPDHTSIGIMSKLITILENHPFTAQLSDTNPTLDYFRCIAEHSPTLDDKSKRTILDIDAGNNRQKFVDFLSDIKELKYLVRTSQAADVIQGGVKVNALPEQVELKINHRINIDSSVGAIRERLENFVIALANEFNLGLVSEGETLIEPTKNGYFSVNAIRPLEPSPISPTSGLPWDLISGTTQNVYLNLPSGNDEDLIIAPFLFPANTDTRHYWSLTRAIYRYNPILSEDGLDIHTVNERLRFRSHLFSVAWYYEFILNSTLKPKSETERQLGGN